MTTPSSPTRRRCLGAAGAALASVWLPAARVQAAAPAQPLPRLVTVGGGITEVVYALQAQDQLVGTDTTSLYPEAAQLTPKVGYLRQLSAEGLLALRPQAVIAPSDAGPPVVLDQLRSAGVQLELVPSTHDWTEVQRKVAAVGRASHRAGAALALQARLDQDWAETQNRVRRHSTAAPRALFVMAHSGSATVSGQQTAAHAMLTLAGARNALTSFNGYRPMTAEAMAAAAPDVIVTTRQSLDATGGEAAFWQRPELALTPAWRRRSEANTLVVLDALELLGFGPRLPQVVWHLHQELVRT